MTCLTVWLYLTADQVGLVGNLVVVRREWLQQYSRQSLLTTVRLLISSMAVAHAIACSGK